MIKQILMTVIILFSLCFLSCPSLDTEFPTNSGGRIQISILSLMSNGETSDHRTSNVLDEFDSMSLVEIIHEENGWEHLMLHKKIGDKLIFQSIPFSGQFVKSARFIHLRYGGGVFIEVIGETHQGHGTLEIFTTGLTSIFSSDFIDSNMESKEYASFKEYEIFKNLDSISGEISRVYRGDSLAIEYLDNKVRIYGFYDYYLSTPENESGEIIYSEEIDKYFIYNNETHRFDEQYELGKYGIQNW